MPTRSARVLRRTVLSQIKPTIGAEIGVWRGSTSEHLLGRFPKLHLLMVDRWTVLPKSEHEHDPKFGEFTQDDMDAAYLLAKQRTEFAASRREILCMDSVSAARRIRSGCLDFAYIDALHDYDSVCRDISSWYMKVRPGGILCGHDYGGHGDEVGIYGVSDAVGDMSKRIGFEFHVASANIWWAKM